MAIKIRRSNERGRAEHGWLNTFFTFSFAHYYDPEHMGFRSLRVINDDQIAPERGFDAHPHRDMEIISYVLEGALEHKDSMGNGSVIRPGDVQRMSAGKGVVHSEHNPLGDETTRLLQIWIEPKERGIEPSYEEKHYSAEQKRSRLLLVASNEGRDGSVSVHQDADLYASRLEEGEVVEHRFAEGRAGWLQVARGQVELNDLLLEEGDGAAIEDVASIQIVGRASSEILLFDLA